MRGHNLARDTFRSEQRCSSGVASMTVHHRPKPSATQRASTLTECQVIGRTPSQFGRMSRRASAVCMRSGRAACGRVATGLRGERSPRRLEGCVCVFCPSTTRLWLVGVCVYCPLYDSAKRSSAPPRTPSLRMRFIQASKPSGYRFGLSRNVSIFNLNQYITLTPSPLY
jgi:hypothetical protein